MKNISPENMRYSPSASNSNCTNTFTTDYFYSYPNQPNWFPQSPWVQPNYIPWNPNPWIIPVNVQPIVIEPLKQIFNNPKHVKTTMLRGEINKYPEAYITINKSRVKMFGLYAYIADNTEFEIELYNPSNETIGAKFQMNGKPISDSHLILYPGQRMILDRYLNENRKFKYITYEVENSKESKEAIANNGLISIEFYRETVPGSTERFIITSAGNVGIGNATPTTKLDINNILRSSGTTANNNYYSHTTTNNDIGTTTFTKSSSDNVIKTTTDLNYVDRTGYTPGVLGYKTSIHDYRNFIGDVFPEPTKDIETGMIAKGEESDQEFDAVDMQFEFEPVSAKVFQLSPISQKPMEAKDLLPLCNKSECNKRGKKDDIYCPKCGTKY